MERVSGGQSEMPRTRPVAITVVSILGLIGAAPAVVLVFSETARQIGPWYPPYLGASAVIGAICMVGLWLMRKWAVYGYTAFVAVNQFIMLSMGVWTPLALFLPGIVVVVMFFYLSRMQ